jgi:ubiquinone/menaquinone biosynthesis C-methylase UbiE
MAKLNPDDWTQYWDEGNTTTFMVFGTGNYDLEILDFWRSWIDNSCEHVVDLACGNGALVWIADDILNKNIEVGGRATKISGVDIANITPYKTLKSKKSASSHVRFHPNTPISSLPFADTSVDLMISQYGIEYGDFDETIPEVDRVLKVNGKLCFIMHDKQSDILKESRPMIEIVDHILYEEKLVDAFYIIDDIYNTMSMKEALNHADAVNAWAKISRVIYSVRLKYQNLRALEGSQKKGEKCDILEGFLNQIGPLFSQKTPNKNMKRKKIIAEKVVELKKTKRRIEDLNEAALSEQDMDNFVNKLTDLNYEIVERSKLAYRASKNWGNIFVAVKNKA